MYMYQNVQKKYDEQDVLIPWHIPKKKYLNNKNLNKKDYTESEKSEHLVKYERYSLEYLLINIIIIIII